jgi:type 1 glutamine amidotransferase
MNPRLQRLASLVAVLIFSLASCVTSEAAEPVAKRILLLGQKPDGHPAGTHEYLPGQRILKTILERVPGVTVEIVQADDPWTEGPELLAKADGVVLFVSEGAKWISADPRRYEAFTKLAERGGGFTGIHWGIGTKDAKNIEPFVKLFGACHGGPDRKYKFTDFEVTLPGAEHPICSGLKPFGVNEEFYYTLKRAGPAAGKLTPLAEINAAAAGDVSGSTSTSTAPTPLMVSWAFERKDGGRSFGFSGLHYHRNWEREEYRRLMTQVVLWTMKVPVPKAGLDLNVSQAQLK